MLPQLTPLPCLGHPPPTSQEGWQEVPASPWAPVPPVLAGTSMAVAFFRVGACPPAWTERVSVLNSGKCSGEIPIPESTGLGFYQGSLTQAEEQLDAQRGPVQALGGIYCECFVSGKLLKWGLESLG